MDSASASSGLTVFALRLAKHLARALAEGEDRVGGGNVVFSPLFVYSALALLAAVASGATLQELLHALAAFVRGVAERALADRSPSGRPTVAFVSGVWHDAAWALLPEYRDEAAASYKAEPANAASEINRWVAPATNNLIDSILAPASVQRGTSLVLANAIYFKGSWETPFLAERTTVDKFHRLDSSAADVPFMRSFDAGQADFSGMARRDDAGGMPLFVGDVCHKAVVEVNEEGTEAAVATAYPMRVGSSAARDRPVTVDFVADLPFVLFMTEEVTGAIVFVGHVLDPSTSG